MPKKNPYITPAAREKTSQEISIEKGREEVAACIGDLHIPYEDKEAVELAFLWLKENQPDRIFLMGDIVDFYSLSRFDKDPQNRQGHIVNEIERAKQFLGKVRESCPKAKIHYICGNHEGRLRKYLMKNAPAIYDLVKLDEILELKDLDIEWIPGKKEASLQYGDTLIGHFDRVNKNSGYTVMNLMNDKGMSVVQAHTHRLAHVVKTTRDKILHGLENGCLCDRSPEYVNDPNWQSGFSLIFTDEEGNQTYRSIHIENGKFTYKDDEYSYE
jgi:UDP-2,3-diacylglucosamine pyrophosphatase LpxH